MRAGTGHTFPRTLSCLLATVVLVSAPRALAQKVDLFPKRAIETGRPLRDTPPTTPIDAAWRAVERSVGVQLQPNVSSVTDESAPVLLARQVAKRREARSSPTDRRHDDSRALPSVPFELQAEHEEQVDAAQAAYEQPARWEAVEVEACLDKDGQVVSTQVVASSHRRALDMEALQAVRCALGVAGGRALKGPVVARFRLEAGVSVAMPARGITHEVSARPTGIMVPVVRGRFGDDRPTEVSAPLQLRVRTRVRLIELTSPR